MLILSSHAAFGQTDSVDTTLERNIDTITPPPRVRKPVTPSVTSSSKKFTDTAHIIDSIIPSTFTDSVKDYLSSPDTFQSGGLPVAPGKFTGIDSLYARFLNNPYLEMKGKPVYQILQIRERNDKDELFYLVAGLVLFLAVIKLMFSKFFRNVFRLFFQPSFRQNQTREQLMQNNLLLYS
jgi:hypothetical protein